ncbi:hypothetical protein CK203_052844 [Vitis vinifera]|uniref:Uncharacterized protein n=1 Tax=Vitis vinifera TaxID=29760 RepID=A0A438H7W6_VITVI|nr:hypothetical protein CK203_052844 [Vitis vinifera]
MLKSLWQELDLFYDLEWSCAEDSAQYQRIVEKECVNCLCKNPFSFVWIQEEVEIELGTDSKCASEDEGEKLKVKVLVKWSRKDWLA